MAANAQLAGRDAYVRVSIGGVSRPTTSQERWSLTFVDVDISDLTAAHRIVDPLKHIRLTPHLFTESSMLAVFRWPLMADGFDDFDIFLERSQDWIYRLTGRDLPVAVLVQPGGDAPYLSWPDERPEEDMFPDDAEIIARCRSAELNALLRHGGAIWSPNNHHYRLPSGAHAGAFVRVADAARSSADTYALSSWFGEALTEDLVVVLDSSTLMPLAVAFQLAAVRAGFAPPRIEVVANYHQTSFDIRELMLPAQRVLVVQSVSSTGSLTERLAAALDRSGTPGDIHVLVDRQSSDVWRRTPVTSESSLIRWLGLRELDDVYANQSLCRICADPRRSRFLQIDSKSFDALILPRPRLVTPSIRAARHNRSLWELATANSALGMLTKPSAETAQRRPPFIDVRFYMGHLFANVHDEDVEKAIRLRVDSNSRRIEDRKLHETDCVVTWEPTSDEWSMLGKGWFEAAKQATRDFIELVFRAMDEETDANIAVPQPQVIFVDRNSVEVLASDADLLNSASNITVFDWSTITGHSLRSLLAYVRFCVQSRRKPPRIRGMVAHARPESDQSFADLQSAFDQDLLALWLTFMPLSSKSPFRRERELLAGLQQAIDQRSIKNLSSAAVEDIRLFIKCRLGVLGHSGGNDWHKQVESFERGVSSSEMSNPYAIYWGSSQRIGKVGPDEYRPRHSRTMFGSGLDAVALFAATGNAVQTVRNEAFTGMDWQQFDLPSTVDAFQDPLAVVAFLRWLEPEEIWWGDDSNGGRRVVSGLISKADAREQPIVVAELLLAAAQGKLSEDAIHVPVEHARSMVQDKGIHAQARIALQAGLALVQSEVTESVADRSATVADLQRLNHHLRRIDFPLSEAERLIGRTGDSE